MRSYEDHAASMGRASFDEVVEQVQQKLPDLDDGRLLTYAFHGATEVIANLEEARSNFPPGEARRNLDKLSMMLVHASTWADAALMGPQRGARNGA